MDADSAPALFVSEDFTPTLDPSSLLALGGEREAGKVGARRDRLVALKLGASAFSFYFAVLLIKLAPFAGTYPGERLCGLPMKSALALCQTIGYLCGKPLALVLVPKLRREDLRAGMLAALWGEGLCLALAPRFGSAAIGAGLFAGGLFGASAWSLLVRACEGRARTDAIIAAASFCAVGMGGVAKAVGAALIVARGLSNGAMVSSCAVGGICLGSCCAFLLCAQEPPSAADVRLRGERRALSSLRQQGARLLRRHGLGVLLSTCAYTTAGTLRAYRDFYQPELFQAVGLGGRPQLLAESELLIGACVLLCVGALSAVADSWRALNLIVWTAAGGGLLVAASSLALRAGALPSGFAWVGLVGCGLFLAYIPIGTVLYERLLAAAHEQLTTSLLSILSDGCVYLGTAALLLASAYAPRTAAPGAPGAAEAQQVRDFFAGAATVGGLAVLALMLLAGGAFNDSIRRTRLRSGLLGLPILPSHAGGDRAEAAPGTAPLLVSSAGRPCPPPSDSPAHSAGREAGVQAGDDPDRR